MKEKFKNELLLMLDNFVDNEVLKTIDSKLDLLLSNYDISLHKNEVVPYSCVTPETVKIYLVTKKIAGLSMKSLYLYNIVLSDFLILFRRNKKR